jgi:hypothetical protein
MRECNKGPLQKKSDEYSYPLEEHGLRYMRIMIDSGYEVEKILRGAMYQTRSV